jgi:Ca-activated chloride channel homolog
MWNGNKFKAKLHGVSIIILISNILLYGGIACIIIALSGPGISTKQNRYLNRGIDIMFIIDESPSMAAKDFPPINRLESAKRIISRFIDGRENDSIGIISFSENASLRAPLTLDYKSVKDSLNDIEIMSLGEGTSIGMGLTLGVLHLRDGFSTSKVVILLTDGINNSGEIPPISAAKAAKEHGVRVYTIGVGGDDPTEVEFFDKNSQKVIRGIMNEGGFDQELLEDIANITGGNFYKATSPGMLETVFQGINYLETGSHVTETKMKFESFHNLFILISFFSLLGYFFLRKIILGEVL